MTLDGSVMRRVGAACVLVVVSGTEDTCPSPPRLLGEVALHLSRRLAFHLPENEEKGGLAGARWHGWRGGPC